MSTEKTFKYLGVSIDIPKEKPVFTHSVPLMIATFGKVENNMNIPYFEKLLLYKQTDLPEGEIQHDVCALNSIRNLNYQINNGGFEQYYFNQYHKYSSGQDVGDLTHLGIAEQIKFLDKFILFILLDKDKEKYSCDLTKAVMLFRSMPNKIKEYEELGDEKEYSCIGGAENFDKQWYKVSEVIEWGMELYAQYLIKRLEAMHIEPSDKQYRVL